MASGRCIAFGGLRVDDAIEDALFSVVGPGAIVAAVAADKESGQRRDQVLDALKRDLEATRYAVDCAFRQYATADPVNRLVAGELERRWNQAVARLSVIESKLPSTTRQFPPRLPILHRVRCSRQTSRQSGLLPRPMRG
jgi:hypothetical protein